MTTKAPTPPPTAEELAAMGGKPNPSPPPPRPKYDRHGQPMRYPPFPPMTSNETNLADAYALAAITIRELRAEIERLQQFRDRVLAAIIEHAGGSQEYAYIWQSEWDWIKAAAGEENR